MDETNEKPKHAQVKRMSAGDPMLYLDGFEVYLCRNDDGQMTVAICTDAAEGVDVFPNGCPSVQVLINDGAYETLPDGSGLTTAH